MLLNSYKFNIVALVQNFQILVPETILKMINVVILKVFQRCQAEILHETDDMD